jgi:hypothetical protein
LAENLVVAVGGAVMLVRWCNDRGTPADFALRIGVWARRGRPVVCARVCSGCERGASASVAVQGEAVDHERVAEQVERLSVGLLHWRRGGG